MYGVLLSSQSTSTGDGTLSSKPVSTWSEQDVLLWLDEEVGYWAERKLMPVFENETTGNGKHGVTFSQFADPLVVVSSDNHH